MEASGRQIWRLLRPAAISAGPLKVLRRIGPYGCLHDRLPLVAEQWGAKRVLKRLCLDEKPIDMEAACDHLFNFATPGRRLYLSTREAADRMALDLLDACATLPEDNPGALLAESVAAVIGTKVAILLFDGGGPGSAQAMEAWRVRKKFFVTGGDVGACWVCNNLDHMLAWWIREWDYADIRCSGMKASFIEALGLVPSDGFDSERSVRINGQWWKRRNASAET